MGRASYRFVTCSECNETICVPKTVTDGSSTGQETKESLYGALRTHVKLKQSEEFNPAAVPASEGGMPRTLNRWPNCEEALLLDSFFPKNLLQPKAIKNGAIARRAKVITASELYQAPRLSAYRAVLWPFSNRHSPKSSITIINQAGTVSQTVPQPAACLAELKAFSLWHPGTHGWRNIGISNNVGGVKHDLSVLLHALRRARHFALVE
jgi:hypothetical protein